MLLAVYGTLRRGAINHHELRGASFMGEALVMGDVKFNRLFTHPLASATDTAPVELYEVPDFTELDAFEAPDYVRTRVRLLDGRKVWVYL